MRTYHGKSVYAGIAIGKIMVWKKNTPTVKRVRVSDYSDEMGRFIRAKEITKYELLELYDKALKEVGEDNAAIFEIHAMMIEDEDYNNSVENIIKKQGVNAEYAVARTGENFSKMFSEMEDLYMQSRAIDVKDISERIISVLTGDKNHLTINDEASVIAAYDLAPSETVQLDKSKVLGFITQKGTLNSHTAILARTMNIPAIIGIDFEEISKYDGKSVILDGFSGTVYVDPDSETLEKMTKLKNDLKEERELLKKLKGKENITLCGKKINVFANIGNIKDLALVLKNDAGGIGLMRSEFIFLERNSLPTEEEQYEIYKTVAQTMAGKKAIIRTLDIGADKKADYLGLPEEVNPAMGLRAIRLCLKRPDIFKTQLRALFRAAVHGNVSVMYPMISSVDEIKKIKAVVNEVRMELESENVPHKICEQGIMIETPASVMISDLLAKEVDFFSIGTNDLSQYTMAIDRENDELDEFFDVHSPAVLRMIEMTVKNAHKENIWVGICGELGADTELCETFIRMGVDELSVSPARVLGVRKKIRELRID